jgi:preprotein translocase subunit SecY
MWRAFVDAFKIPDLRQKILFTLAVLAIYRLGAAIPTPGVDASSLTNNLNQGNLGGVLGVLGLVSGGNLEQFSIFALGVLPYITASIIMQIMTTAIPALEKMQKEGPEGAKRIQQYTRIAAIGLAAMQAFFFANLLQSQGTFVRIGWNPAIFMLVLVITQMAGCAFTMWLGEQITERGIGNGISMIIFAGIVHRFPIEFGQTFRLLGTQFDLLAPCAVRTKNLSPCGCGCFECGKRQFYSLENQHCWRDSCDFCSKHFATDATDSPELPASHMGTASGRFSELPLGNRFGN